ncbi:DNA polymerase III subunit alpha [Pedobacter cryophilus]|uniref:DNA polymerase III subunit alpha n=1 Tax=Pedobacter cryophilus TaxID=2571271 RepID=A0A4U1C197_9SPHI|nr:DNA polymerase III subunit alpha [Pedobacter cryophilus]TKB98825.1 DNA polymerase III subunit alpha [Pedobacter cryophilus]
MYLIFDTETTGLPKRWDAPITDTDNWPRCIQIAWQLHNEMGELIAHEDYLVKPDGFNIPYDAERIHGISTELAIEKGIPLAEVLEKFNTALAQAKFVVGQNLGFDINIMGCELHRMACPSILAEMPILDTCTEVTASLLKLPGGRGGKFKLPNLTELHQYLFDKPFAEAHNATADVEATTRCFFELVRREVFTKEELQVEVAYFEEFKNFHSAPVKSVGLKHVNLKEASSALKANQKNDQNNLSTNHQSNLQDLADVNFVHLHNHTQFSILQSTISVASLIKAAAKYKMPAVAITDHANMMGAFHFVSGVLNHNKAAEAKNKTALENGEQPTETIIKPIVGCEFFVCDDLSDKKRKDNGYQIVVLAKNKNGYHHLAKMSSLAYTSGFYYVPRIDRATLVKYKEDLIILSGNLYGEIANKLLNLGENQAEEALIWWKQTFGANFYIELMRHHQEDEDRVNQTLITLAKKHDVKLVATNNTYYINKEDAHAHDILLCVKEGEKLATPKGRGRGFRFGMPNDEYYFKSGDEMKKLFSDVPESIINIQEVIDKIETYSLYREVLLPKFDIPEEFLVAEDEADGGKRGENKYLAHLTYVGAAKRYPNLTPEIKERLDFELQTIEKTGYPGYFLIVQDFIAKARELDVSVGPGRGSAAGSAVAYCLWITNIDPIAYDLLFERFLNPDRVSMPDIDIDFDDEGRGRVMDYVINKYGASQVAQIITYGTMAAKSAIRDTARVLDLPLFEADKIAKLIPNLKLNKIFTLDDAGLKSALRSEEMENVTQLKNLAGGKDVTAETIKQAQVLEGSLRNTGIHACGVIITPSDITNFVPVATAKDSDLYVTQFDNSVVESAGLLKMDFLGLKTLTLIKDSVKLVKFKKGIDLDPDTFPIDDEKTYELFQRGETVGIFQYESPGMQKHLKDLKPTVFGDLIAMNALYRPGPMEYIPSFVKRKNGEEEIKYDLAASEEYLKETYGITVYQEQVMLLSQKLADFTKGEADVLRKAMGKKQKDVLDKMKPKFVAQAAAKGHDPVVLEKVWKDWEAFASYAFNKSHSTCYAWIAYQTAYLKANYPAEYMAAVLSNNMSDIKQVSFFMEECRRMGLDVLGPDVNESFHKFTVNDQNAIRFGMGAVKGVGAGAVDTIVTCRASGKYKSIFDFAKRVDLRAANKKALENLVLAGGFDCFENTHRAQYFNDADEEGISPLEKAIKYGVKFKENENSSQASLFGGSSNVALEEPSLPPCEEWGAMEKLAKEKEVVGIYISGHPLDEYKLVLTKYCSKGNLTIFNEIDKGVDFQFKVGGILTSIRHMTTKDGRGWGIFKLDGYDDSFEFTIYRDDYLKFKHHLVPNNYLYVKGNVGYFSNPDGSKRHRTSYGDFSDLRDVLEKQSTKIDISLDINHINDTLISDLDAIFSNHVGSKKLNFIILDKKDKLKIDLQSKGRQVNISKELLAQLDEIELDYVLN